MNYEGADRIEYVLEQVRQMKRAHAASSSSSKRGHENGEMPHRSVAHHYTLQQRVQIQNSSTSASSLMEYASAEASIRQQQQQQPRLAQHLPGHHVPHVGRASGSITGALKRPPADEDEHNEVPPVAIKRNTEEAALTTRPPLTRGESLPLPAGPFVQERSKHPVRAPSFDTATFKAAGK